MKMFESRKVISCRMNRLAQTVCFLRRCRSHCVVLLAFLFFADRDNHVQAGIPPSQLQYSYSLASLFLPQGRTNPVVTAVNDNPPPHVKSGDLFVSHPKIHKTFLLSRIIQSIEQSLKACEEPVDDEDLQQGEIISEYYQIVGTQLRSETDSFRRIASRIPEANDEQVKKFIELTETLSINICRYTSEDRYMMDDIDEQNEISTEIAGALCAPVVPRMSRLTVTSGGARNNRHFSTLVESGGIPQITDFSADGCLKEFDCTLDLPETNQMISFHRLQA